MNTKFISTCKALMCLVIFCLFCTSCGDDEGVENPMDEEGVTLCGFLPKLGSVTLDGEVVDLIGATLERPVRYDGQVFTEFTFDIVETNCFDVRSFGFFLLKSPATGTWDISFDPFEEETRVFGHHYFQTVDINNDVIEVINGSLKNWNGGNVQITENPEDHFLLDVDALDTDGNSIKLSIDYRF